jgi:hypothetical protein
MAMDNSDFAVLFSCSGLKAAGRNQDIEDFVGVGYSILGPGLHSGVERLAMT